MTGPQPEVLVVGGGPAGSTIAGLLARAGRSVTLVDRSPFPRAKPCGECLNPGAIRALDRLALRSIVEGLEPTRLTGWRLQTAGVAVASDFGGDLHGLAVSRSKLDAALLEHAEGLGVKVLVGLRAEHAEPARGPSARPRVVMRLPDGSTETWSPQLVIGADGLRSRIAAALGLVARAPHLARASFTFHLAAPHETSGVGTLDVRLGATLGLAPLQGDLWNATLVVDAGAPARSVGVDPRAALRRALADRFPVAAEWPLVAGPWTSGPFDRPIVRPWADGVLLVGDAAGYFDPFTGQGMYRAFRTAELAAAAADGYLSSDRGSTEPLQEYERLWRREVRPRRWIQQGVDRVMAHPRVRAAALRRLGASGGLSQVIRVTGDVAPPRSLLHPSVWFRAFPGTDPSDPSPDTHHADHR